MSKEPSDLDRLGEHPATVSSKSGAAIALKLASSVEASAYHGRSVEDQAPIELEHDRELLDRYRRGERAALALIFRAYAPEVARALRRGFRFETQGRRCAFHGTRSAFDLEDRLHDVFVRAFGESARLGYDGITPFGVYLKSIMRNLVIDDFRRKERALVDYSFEEAEAAAPAEQHGEPLSGLVTPSGAPEQDAAGAELLALVERFERSLDERDGTVYRLRYVSELEHHDVAARTGLSESKVKTSEKRIRLAFFSFMRGHGYFSGYEQEPKSGWLRRLWAGGD